MAKCPHCGKELEFTVIPRKPKLVKPVVKSAAKTKAVKTTGTKAKPAAKPGTVKAAGTKAKPTAKPASKKAVEPKAAPKRPLLKNPDFLNPGSIA
jgi:hypothetical protein